MKEEFNLSEYMGAVTTENWAIKEFIKRLKKFNWFIEKEDGSDEEWEDTLIRHNNFIDKLAGEKLI